VSRYEAEAAGDSSRRFATVTDLVDSSAGAATVPTSIVLFSSAPEAVGEAVSAVQAWLAKERKVSETIVVPAAKLEDGIQLLQGEVEAKFHVKVRARRLCPGWEPGAVLSP
jgi:hypothetical protein